jgi:hypothetical protein
MKLAEKNHAGQESRKKLTVLNTVFRKVFIPAPSLRIMTRKIADATTRYSC